MTLLHAAERAGILPRVCEILADAACEATEQISTGCAQIRAYRIWIDREQRHFTERRRRLCGKGCGGRHVADRRGRR